MLLETYKKMKIETLKMCPWVFICFDKQIRLKHGASIKRKKARHGSDTREIFCSFRKKLLIFYQVNCTKLNQVFKLIPDVEIPIIRQ